MTDREVMQQALETIALLVAYDWQPDFTAKLYDSDEPEENELRDKVLGTITALRAALAQECDSPDWCNEYNKCHRVTVKCSPLKGCKTQQEGRMQFDTINAMAEPVARVVPSRSGMPTMVSCSAEWAQSLPPYPTPLYTTPPAAQQPDTDCHAQGICQRSGYSIGAQQAEPERICAAYATLLHLGYTWEGGEQWKPPLGKAQQAEPVGHVYRYGKDSGGKAWHGIHWYSSGLDLPDGTRVYVAPPATQQAEPVAWIQPDHLQKARVAPFLCRVEPTKRCSDFVPIYTAPPAAQQCSGCGETDPGYALYCAKCIDKWTAPQQADPVAYRHLHEGEWEYYDAPTGQDCAGCQPLYTTPPAAQRKPLTDEEITEIFESKPRWHYPPIGATDREFARDIERAHGIVTSQEP